MTDHEVEWLDTVLTADGKSTAFEAQKGSIFDKLSKDKERSIEEVAGCRAILTTVYLQAQEPVPLNEATIRGLHQELLRYYAKAEHYARRYKTTSNQKINLMSERGESLSEYGLIIGLVVILAIGGLTTLGMEISGLLTNSIVTGGNTRSTGGNSQASLVSSISNIFGDRFGGYDILSNGSIESIILPSGKTIHVPLAPVEKLSETLGPNGGTLGVEASVLALINALEKENPEDPSIPELKTWANLLHQKAGLQKLADESSIRFAYQAETGESVQDTYRVVADPWDGPKDPDFMLGGDSSGGPSRFEETFADKLSMNMTFNDFLQSINGMNIGDRATLAGHWLKVKLGKSTSLGSLITKMNTNQSNAGIKTMDYYNTINMPPELVSPEVFTTLKTWQPNLTTSRTANQSCLISNTDGQCLKMNPKG